MSFIIFTVAILTANILYCNSQSRGNPHFSTFDTAVAHWKKDGCIFPDPITYTSPTSKEMSLLEPCRLLEGKTSTDFTSKLCGMLIKFSNYACSQKGKKDFKLTPTDLAAVKYNDSKREQTVCAYASYMPIPVKNYLSMFNDSQCIQYCLGVSNAKSNSLKGICELLVSALCRNYKCEPPAPKVPELPNDFSTKKAPPTASTLFPAKLSAPLTTAEKNKTGPDSAKEKLLSSSSSSDPAEKSSPVSVDKFSSPASSLDPPTEDTIIEKPKDEFTKIPSSEKAKEEPFPEIKDKSTEKPLPETKDKPMEKPSPEITEKPPPEIKDNPTEKPSPEITEKPPPEIKDNPTEKPSPEIKDNPTEKPPPEIKDNPTEKPSPEIKDNPTEKPSPEIAEPSVTPKADDIDESTFSPDDAEESEYDVDSDEDENNNLPKSDNENSVESKKIDEGKNSQEVKKENNEEENFIETDIDKAEKSKHDEESLNIKSADEDGSYGSGHFLAYFLTAVVICISGYIIYHNKQKIMAFVIEGRSSRGGRQRSKEVKYSRLKSNVEEVIPTLEKTASAKNFVY